MYKIAICDDGNITCTQLETLLMQDAKKKNRTLDIDIFFTGRQLLEQLDTADQYDMLFLDIELETPTSGIEIGKYIRDQLHNETLLLIYISSHQQYAMQLFQNRPFDFIVKPFDLDQLSSLMDKTCHLIDSGNQYFEFISGHTLHRIRYADIIYFRSIRRKILVMTIHGEYEFYDHLDAVAKRLPDGQFIQIHKSYVIRYAYIGEYNYMTLTTIQNETLNISKPYRKHVRDTILKR